MSSVCETLMNRLRLTQLSQDNEHVYVMHCVVDGSEYGNMHFCTKLEKMGLELMRQSKLLFRGGDTQVFGLFCCFKDGCKSAECDMCFRCRHQAEVMSDSKSA